MKVYILLNERGESIRFQYKRGTYGHLGFFTSYEDMMEAVNYYGGQYTWTTKTIELDK